MADPCRNCGAALAPGAAFCTLCGTTVANRAASPAPTSVPLGGSSANPYAPGGNPFAAAAPGETMPGPSGSGSSGFAGGQHNAAGMVPGIINVATTPGGPLVPPVQVGEDPRGAAATALANAGAGRRLAAKILDGVPPAILVGAASGIGTALISTKPVAGGTQVDFTWLIVLVGVASLLSLAYVVWQWLWEAKTGKTLGNLMLGLRTTNMEGHPAGVLAIFLRSLMVSLSGVVPTVGPILMLVSNTWDKNFKMQGWHDKVAHTLVFNVAKGRNPLETGGIAERERFVPAGVSGISQVQSPLARPAAPAAAHTVVPAAVPAPGAGQFPGAPAPAPVMGAAGPAPTAREGRRRKKAAAVDPFAPPAIQFQNQPFQNHNAQNQNVQNQNVQGQPAPGQQFPGQQGQQPAQFQQQAPGQPGQPYSGQQFQQQEAGPFQGQQANPFAPPASSPQAELPVENGPITTVPGITRPPVAASDPQQSQSQQPFQAQQQGNPFQQPPGGAPQQNFSQGAPPVPPQAMPAQAAGYPPAQGAPLPGADDEAGETRARPQGARSALRLAFDDGRVEELGATALIGRNPAGYDGEMISRLISIQDSTRSVSKTHLHLRVSVEGLWVTDRNSTNGSAITDHAGRKTALVGGTPALAAPGTRVNFGDRSFLVEQA